MSQQNLYRQFNRYLEYHKIEHIKMYNLRHSFVSLMQGKATGEELKPIVRHSAVIDTWGTYGGNIDGVLRIVAAKIDDAYKTIFE